MSPARSLQARSRITCPRILSYVVHVAIHIVLTRYKRINIMLLMHMSYLMHLGERI